MKFGIDRLLDEPALRRTLHGRRVALLAHPASVTRDLTHSLDALAALGDLRLTAAFGPQHGLRGDKQDNMIESADFDDPVHGIPVFSLYGERLRPSPESLDLIDILLVDLPDVYLARERQGGKPLGWSGFYRILGDPYYMGLISLRNGETYKGAHQGVIDLVQIGGGQNTFGMAC